MISQEYLYRCNSCEKQFPVTEKNAGMSADCPFCEKSNNLPGLRNIRQLPARELSAAKQTSKNGIKSLLFSAGLLVGVVGAILAFSLGNYARSLATESKLNEQIEFGQSHIEKMPPGRLWDAWESMTAKGLPDWQETHEVRYNKQSGHLKNISYGLYAISALGLLALLASFFMKNR